MGAPKRADWREERRKRAWKLKEEGWQQLAFISYHQISNLVEVGANRAHRPIK